MDAELGLSGNLQWPGYPSWVGSAAIGQLVAVKDKAGVRVGASNFGTRAESWIQVYPEERLYHFENRVNGAGELIYASDPDGNASTADYYSEGTFKSSYWNGNPVLSKIRTNYRGQTELVQYGDAAQTTAWNGFNPLTGQLMSNVVQQLNHGGNGQHVTLLAFGYEFDRMGKLIGISDWRGRGSSGVPKLGLNTWHPASGNFVGGRTGTHYSAFPSFMDTSMAGPTQWNASDIAGSSTATGWPVGASPSDAVFTYDSLNQLVSEDREYITANGLDSLLNRDETVSQNRVRSLDWSFDTRGSMTEWIETDPNGISEPKNLGRALGDVILNGYQLNKTNGCNMNTLALSSTLPQMDVPAGCYRPDALYFASNISQVATGKGTCVWVEYDGGGRMRKQTVRKNCSSCDYVVNAADKGVNDFSDTINEGMPLRGGKRLRYHF